MKNDSVSISSHLMLTFNKSNNHYTLAGHMIQRNIWYFSSRTRTINEDCGDSKAHRKSLPRDFLAEPRSYGLLRGPYITRSVVQTPDLPLYVKIIPDRHICHVRPDILETFALPAALLNIRSSLHA